jgi:hypothetical protein
MRACRTCPRIDPAPCDADGRTHVDVQGRTAVVSVHDLRMHREAWLGTASEGR